MNKLLLTLIFIPSLSIAAKYQSLNDICDGFPQVAVGSYEGTCVGVINQHKGFKKPRKAVQLDERRLLVTDMGGWSAGRGKLWLVESSLPHLKGDISVTALLTKLDMPHGIELDAKGRVLVGEIHQIRRLELKDGKIVSDKVVIKDLPYKDSLHPLSNFVQLANGDLVINVGSQTDNCEGKIVEGRCSELSLNGLWQYSYDEKSDAFLSKGKHLANGLRNSMALAVHESGLILQAENSSDIKEAEEPYEELNIIQEGKFYGWPYCLNESFDQNIIPKGCEQENYQAPYLFLPPHTAPLDMMYAKSSKLPMIDGKLLMSWHGYRVIGNRLVAYDIESNGLPVLADQAWFNRDPIAPETEWTRHPFNPKGGATRVAQHVEIISHWNKVDSVRPEGAPVGLTMLMDDTLLIVDDKNKALLRLAPGVAYSDSKVAEAASKDRKTVQVAIDLSATQNQVLNGMLLEHCSACHIELSNAPEKLLNINDGWLAKEEGVLKIEKALFSETRPMPPGGNMSLDAKEVLLNNVKEALK